MEKCNSCKNGYDGTHGSRYQPCGCKNKQDLPIGVGSVKKTKPSRPAGIRHVKDGVEIDYSNDFIIGVFIGTLFGIVLTMAATVFLFS